MTCSKLKISKRQKWSQLTWPNPQREQQEDTLGADQKIKKKIEKNKSTQLLLLMLMIDANSFWVPSMSRSWSKSCMHANLCYSHNNLLPHPRPSPPQVATLSCPKPWNHDGLLCHPHPVNQAILLALPSQNIQNAATPHYLCCCSQSYIIFNAVYDNSLPSRYPWSLCSPFYSQHDGIKVHPFQPSAQALAGLPHISVNTKSLQWLISPPSPPISLLYPHHLLLSHVHNCLYTVPPTCPAPQAIGPFFQLLPLFGSLSQMSSPLLESHLMEACMGLPSNFCTSYPTLLVLFIIIFITF